MRRARSSVARSGSRSMREFMIRKGKVGPGRMRPVKNAMAWEEILSSEESSSR